MCIFNMWLYNIRSCLFKSEAKESGPEVNDYGGRHKIQQCTSLQSSIFPGY